MQPRLGGSAATGRMAWAARLAPLVVPAILWASMVPSMGRMPANDYYGIVTQVVEGDHFSADPVRWLHIKSNEHTVVLPALLYAANVSLSGGDNRVLSGLSLLLLFALGALLCSLLPADLRDHRLAGPAWAFVLAGLVFTPAAAHSIVLGFSGTIWFLSNLLAVTAIHRLAASQPSGAAFAGVLAAGLLGTLAYSTNLSLWPALVLGAIALRFPARRIALLAGGGALAFAFAAWTYVRPAHHTAPVFTDPVAVGKFFAYYLGAPLAENPWVAETLGLAGLLVAGLFAALILARREEAETRALTPWFVLQLYVAGNALGTAVARVGMGGAHASRYASVAILFWIGLAIAGAHLATRAGDRRGLPWPGLALAAGLLLVGATWLRGLPVLCVYLERASRQPLAELAIVHRVTDPDAMKAVLPAPQELEALRSFMTSSRHVPFDEPPPVTYGQAVALLPAEGTPPLLDPATISVTPLGEPVLRLEMPGIGALAGAAEAVLIDDAGTVKGALRDVSPPWALRLLRRGANGPRWAGYLAPDSDSGRFLVCVARPLGGPLVPLAVLPAIAIPIAPER